MFSHGRGGAAEGTFGAIFSRHTIAPLAAAPQSAVRTERKTTPKLISTKSSPPNGGNARSLMKWRRVALSRSAGFVMPRPCRRRRRPTPCSLCPRRYSTRSSPALTSATPSAPAPLGVAPLHRHLHPHRPAVALDRRLRPSPLLRPCSALRRLPRRALRPPPGRLAPRPLPPRRRGGSRTQPSVPL